MTTAAKNKTSGKKWLAKVTATSDALDLEGHIFKSDDPKAIATSLKQSAEKSERRKSSPFRSAMSMLNFYINRAGKGLQATQKGYWSRLRMNCVKCTAESRSLNRTDNLQIDRSIKTAY
jgi:hypothetical protein